MRTFLMFYPSLLAIGWLLWSQWQWRQVRREVRALADLIRAAEWRVAYLEGRISQDEVA